MSRIVLDLIDELKKKYNGVLDFKKICEDEKIVAIKTKVPDCVNGLYLRHEEYSFIILNQELTRHERRDRAWHELFHHFRSVEHTKTEEKKADLFASLIRIPAVRIEDTIESLCEKYSVSPMLAKIRIEHEQKKLLK